MGAYGGSEQADLGRMARGGEPSVLQTPPMQVSALFDSTIRGLVRVRGGGRPPLVRAGDKIRSTVRTPLAGWYLGEVRGGI